MMFTYFIGDTAEVYIDDMIVKFGSPSIGLRSPSQVQHAIQSHKVLLRGYIRETLMIKKDIEMDPKQITSLRNIQSPKGIKDVHKITRRLVALNRSISKYS